MMLLDITNFLGRFHPLIVHLPIGIFILAFLLDIISYNNRFSNFRAAVPFIMLTGFIFSILSVLLGFLLSFSGDYDRTVLSAHRNFGITLTVFTGILCLLQLPRVKKWITVPRILNSFFMILMIGFLVYTGHQGANLTHGSDYINLRVLNEQQRERPKSVEEAFLYEDVVQPILNRKCVQCHRQGKKKGRLSLESIADMKKGGKNGAGIVEGNVAESEIIQRVSLDPSDEHFMPADGKTPLTKNETLILKWWIDKAAIKDGQKMRQIKNAAEINGVVGGFLQLKNEETGDVIAGELVDSDIPDSLRMEGVENLRAKGFKVRVMHQHPIILDVTLPPGSKDKLFAASDQLKAVARNVIWLNLSGNALSANELRFLPSMTNLVKLRLEKNKLSNDICRLLLPLTKLEAVNLNETKVTTECINTLKGMPAMKNVYSWGTP